MKTTLLRIGAIAVALQILSASAETQVLYVVPSGTAGNTPESPYATWETAANSIADALGAVTDEAVINVKPGVYNIDQQINVDKPNVTIQSCDESGSLARETTILDGGYPARYPKATTNRLFRIQRENVTLRGLTLQNSCVLDNGGGVHVDGSYQTKISGKTTTISISNFIIDSCVISNCYAIYGNSAKGGGVAYHVYTDRQHIITNSIIRNCVSSRNGAGISGSGNALATKTSHLLLIDSSFIDNKIENPNNQTTYGIHLGIGSTYAERCLFKGGSKVGGNTSRLNTQANSVFDKCVFDSLVGEAHFGANGGINSFYNCTFRNMTLGSSEVQIYDGCVFSNLVAMSASSEPLGSTPVKNCLWTHNNHPFNAKGLVENCTIVSNNVTGVLMPTASSPMLINCVIYGNKQGGNSSFLGGANIGYRNKWIEQNTSSLTLKNCYIEDGDTATIKNPQAANALTKLQDFDSTGATEAIIAKAKEKGPGFGDEANGDWRLTRKSPLRDAGLNADWMVNATDLEGKPRLLQLNGKYSATATVDLGCYECGLPISEGLRLFLR
jgi:hypothetical protein